ncbi:unnamed protein product [Peniophora sp. CBMAI 1063]|nr:unnamed protein product [Peniophora sp. CBMAI 1063]
MLVQLERVANKTFDYVVVGGGLSGLVVATRLSEDPTLSVLVLEAGDANLGDPKILSPLQVQTHFGLEKYDWKYQTTEQVGLGSRTSAWPRGKGLGGSSAINFMQYHLPGRSDIDAFEKLGNKNWNWDLLRPYYLKCEGFVPPRAEGDPVSYDAELHGKEGPITVTYPSEWSQLETPYMQALESLGLPRVHEPFSGDIKGSWITPVSLDPKTGLRSYAANAYYEPNSGRANLSVLTNAHVIRVDTSRAIQGGLLTASSVAVECEGHISEVRVGKEVILAAGAMGTPQILELSGIGEAKVLSKAGIAVKHALAGVGNNVQEHVRVNTVFELNDDPTDKYQTYDFVRNPDLLKRHLETYMTSLSGPFAMLPSCMAFSPFSVISPDHERLRDELSASLAQAANSGKYSPSVQKQHTIQIDRLKTDEPSCELCIYGGAMPRMPGENQPKEDKKYGTIVFLTNHPFSRGSIHVTGPKSSPVYQTIDPKYFDEEYDLKSIVEGIKFVRRLVRTGPLKDIFSGLELTPGPECNSDEALVDYVKNNVMTSYHTIGTCSMLPLEDDGVVDTDLKVYGTQNIRVVDVSIIPLQISAHLQATAYAIAELAADIIKGKVQL